MQRMGNRHASRVMRLQYVSVYPIGIRCQSDQSALLRYNVPPVRFLTVNSSSLVALRYRNFRLLWLGQLVSMSGSMMQTAAILWHVSLLVSEAQRPLALGLVGLVRIVPIVFFSIDRKSVV